MTPFRPANAWKRAVLFALVVPPLPTASALAQSTSIVVESVDDYSLRNGPALPNSVANGSGFLQGMLFIPSSPWHLNANWTNRAVWDTDFMDPAVNAKGCDSAAA
jgi:hypothetical protein